MIERAELDLEMREEIGMEGRNSRTFVAFDTQLNATLVAKRIPRADFTDEAEYFKEAQRLYDARHPNVVPVQYACRMPDEVCLVMPRYATSLQALLERENLTVREIVRYGLGFLSGLHHVHVRKLIHLDVKPSNILIDAADRAAIADFGLSRYVDRRGLADHDVMYRRHRVPESLTGSKVGAQADIYQAGLTLYRMTLGADVLDEQWAAFGVDEVGAFKAVLRGELPDRSNQVFPAHVPNDLRRLIQKAMEVDPDDRFPTILDMISALGEVSEFLDWRYEDDGAGLERWTKQVDEREYEVTLEHTTPTEWKVKSLARNKDGDGERVHHKLAGNASTSNAARKLVRKALESH